MAQDVILNTKYVNVGPYVNGTWGYQNGLYGDISDTSGGSTNRDIELYNTSGDQVNNIAYFDSVKEVRFGISLSAVNSASYFSAIKMGNTTFNRTDIKNHVPNTGNTYWSWSSNVNPFGTTSGANIPVEIIYEVDEDQLTSGFTVTNVSLSSNETATSVFTLNVARTDQSYRLVKISGTTAGGTANGAVVGSIIRGTTGTFSITTNDQPSDGNIVSYQLQTGGEFSDVNNDDAFTPMEGDRVNTIFWIQRGDVVGLGPVKDIRFGPSATYTTRSVDLTPYAGADIRVVFHHQLPFPTNTGGVFLGDLQIDDVQFDGNSYSFENSGQSWQTTTANTTFTAYGSANFSTLAVGGTAARWNVGTGNTQSGNTGNLGADAGSYYVYTETSSPTADGAGFWLRSPTVTLGSSPGNLTFAEGRQGSNIGTLRTFIETVTIASNDIAPAISTVTNDDALSASVQVTVNLSSTGQGGTGLYYGRSTTTNSDNVTSWQTSNSFRQSRSSNFYYFASRQNTVGSGNTLASSPVLEAVPYVNPGSIDLGVKDRAYLPVGTTTFNHEIITGVSGESNVTVYEIRSTNYNGTIHGSRTGPGTITVTDNPGFAPKATKTYYLTSYVPVASGGDGISRSAGSGATFLAKRSGDLAGTVTLAEKYIDVGTTTNSGGVFHGYNDGGGWGDISNTADGTTNNTISGVFASSGTTDILGGYFQDYISDQTFLQLSKSSAFTDDGTLWTKLTADGLDFLLSDANVGNSGSPQYSYFAWSTNKASSPYQFTTGANILIQLKYEADTTATASITNTSLASAQVANSIVTITSPNTTQRYRIIKVSGTTAGGVSDGTSVGDRNGSGTITIDNNEQPTAGNTCTYQIQTSAPYADTTDDYSTGSKWTDVTGTNNSFTITRGSAASAPIISDVTNDNAAAPSVTVTVSLSNNGAGGTGLYYGRASTNNSDNVTTWQTSNTFSQNRGADFYYFASRQNTVGSGNTLASTGVLEEVDFLLPDRDIDFTLTPGSSISSAYAGNVTVNVTNGSPDNRYRALRTTGGNLGCGNTGLIAGTTGTITIGDAANELPVSGSSFSYTLQARLGTSSGGDDVTWYTVTSSPNSFNISRGADNTPEGFTDLAGDVADADLSTQHYATFSGTTAGTTSPGTGFDVGTTIDNGTDISVSNGEYSLNGGSTWLSSTATINQNQVVYFRGQSASTNGTETTHSLTIGDTTRSFTTTTFGDTFPETYTNLAGNNVDASLNTVYYATFSTAQPGTTFPGTAFNVGTTISNSTIVSVNNGEYRINSGSFTSTEGQINQNDDIYFRSNATASASGQTLIASLTIGSISHNFQLKTGALPGNTAGLNVGSETYGVVVYGPDGTTEVWGSNIRQTNIIIKEYFSLPNNTSSSFVCADANDNTKVILSVGSPYPSGRADARAAAENLSVTKTSTGFTVTNQENASDPNSTSATLAVRVIAARIS